MRNHSLFTTLANLRGNPRGCVYTEPLWGIPFNLYAPYASIFMLALGLSDKQIGLIVSVSWGFQIILALMSGPITDKLGRRRTTLLFDLIAWSLPALISALAQNFWYFLAAGIINSFWRITHNSWTCLLVEDADQSELVDMFTWIYIANQLVGFIAPLTGILIGAYSLIPTVRGLYFFAAAMFTLKAAVTYWMTAETAQGKIRMHETRHQSILSALGEYGSVLRDLLRSSQTLFTAGILLVISISAMINGSFWGIIVTEKLQVPAQNLAVFPFIKSGVILLFFFMATPIINRMHFKLPVIFGFLGFIASHVLLITAPDRSYIILIISTILDACCFAAISPLLDHMLALSIDPKERARIQSIVYVGIILLTSPFGWIAGTLSGIDKTLPFILNIVLFMLGALLAYLAGNDSQKRIAAKLSANIEN